MRRSGIAVAVLGTLVAVGIAFALWWFVLTALN
jgi:hypothetical protein